MAKRARWTVELPAELAEAVEAEARKHGRDRSSQVRVTLRAGLGGDAYEYGKIARQLVAKMDGDCIWTPATFDAVLTMAHMLLLKGECVACGTRGAAGECRLPFGHDGQHVLTPRDGGSGALADPATVHHTQG